MSLSGSKSGSMKRTSGAGSQSGADEELEATDVSQKPPLDGGNRIIDFLLSYEVLTVSKLLLK